jgi:hypothetical protein
MKRILRQKKEPLKRKLKFDVPKTIEYSNEISDDLAKRMAKGEESRWLAKIADIMDDK